MTSWHPMSPANHVCSGSLLARCERNPLVTGGFPSQRASDTEKGLPCHNVSWTKSGIRSHVVLFPLLSRLRRFNLRVPLKTAQFRTSSRTYIPSNGAKCNHEQGKSEGFESCDRPIVRKRPISVKIGDVLSCVTLKFYGWPWKTIRHLSFAVSSFV